MTGQGPNAAAGWYPVDGGQQRYWDGQQWTEHISPAAPETPQPGPTSAQGSPYGQAPAPGSPYGQAPAPGSPYGQAPQPADFGGQAPFAAQQAGWNNAGWQDPAQAQYGQVPAPFAGAAHAPASSEDRSLATVCHLLGLFFGFVGPLIVWIVKKDESSYVTNQAKEALNFQFSMILYWFVTFFLLFFLIGFLLLPVVIILQVVLPIVAAVAANKGDYYRYPLTLRFVT